MADVPTRAGVAGTYLQSYSFGPPSFGVSQGVGSAWFGPNAPLRPTAPPDVVGRQFDFPVGYNLNTRTRAYSGISFRDLRELADGYGLLSIVIETRKDQVARMSWSIKNRDATAKDADDPRVKAITSFFQRPDGVHGWADWLRPVLDDLFVIDAPALYVRRNRGGHMVGLVQVDGATIMPLIDEWGRTPEPIPYSGGPVLLFGSTVVQPDEFAQYNIQAVDGVIYPPAYQQVLKGLPAVDYTTRDLIYRPRCRRVHSAYGRSPVEQIVDTVNIALRRQLSTLNYFTEGNIPDMMIQVPKEWTPDQIVAYQKHWDAYLTGDLGARRRAKFVPTQGSGGIHETRQQDLKGDFDEWLAKLVCFAFSISPQALIRQMNRASGETQKELAEEEGLEPLLLWLKTFIDDIIAQEFDAPDLEFSWDDNDDIDEAQQLTVLTGYASKGIITINEARDKIGYDPFPNPEASQPMIITATGLVPLGSYQQQQDQAAENAQLLAEARAKQEAAGGANGEEPSRNGSEPGGVEKYSPDQPRDASGRFASSDTGITTKQKVKLGIAVAAAAYLVSAGLRRKVPYHTGDTLKTYFDAMTHREVIAELHKRSVHTPITEAERKSLVTYTGPQYKTINKKLRLGHKPNDDINNIDAALQKSSLAENTVVYRGLNMDRSKRIMKTQPGDVFVDRGYPSTSISEDVARRFASSADGAGTNQVTPEKAGYVLSINVDKGATALPLAAGYSQSSFLHEVLLPRSSAFQMLSVDPDTKTIYMQHLGVAASKAESSNELGMSGVKEGAGDDADRFLWSDGDIEIYEAPEGDTTAEDYAGYKPPQPDVAKAYDPDEARISDGEWTSGGGSSASAPKPKHDDWAEVKSIGKSIAVGAALTAVASVAVWVAPETFAAVGAVEATEVAAEAAEGSKGVQLAGALGRWVSVKASNTVRNFPNSFINGVNGAAQTAYFAAVYKSSLLILRHLGADTDAIERDVKPLEDAYNEVMKATDAKIGGKLQDTLAEIVDETRDSLIKHLSHYKGTDKYSAAVEIVEYAAEEFKGSVLSALGKVAKRSMGGYRRPDPVPFDRPATRRAEKGIKDRLGQAFAAIGGDAARKVKDRLGKLVKADPEPSEEDRARQIADEIASEFDLGPLQDTADDTADDLEDVASDSVSSAVTQIGPSDPGDLVDQVNDRAVAAARDRAAEMVGMRWDDDGSLVPSDDPDMAITETTRDMLRGMIADALASGESTDDLADQISESFALSPERAEMIAATEVSRANSEAALASYQGASDIGVDVKKEWLVATGCCDVCEANAAAGAIDLDDDFPSGDATPPGHPNCRCSLSPVVGEDDDDGDETGKAYNPNQLRDARGRWSTSSVGDAVTAATGRSPTITRSTLGVVRRRAAVSKIVGVNVAGFRHSMSSHGIAHTLSEHGDPLAEASRGQIAVTASDFYRAKDIVDNPDRILQPTARGRHGEPRVVYEKEIGGVTYSYVGEVQRRKRRIEMVTMWKR